MIRVLHEGVWRPAVVRIRSDGAWRTGRPRVESGGRWRPSPEPISFPGDGTIVVRELDEAGLLEPVTFRGDGSIVIGAAGPSPDGTMAPGIYQEGVYA